jgi:hypothetical protein
VLKTKVKSSLLLGLVLRGEQWFVCCGGETGGAVEVSMFELEEEMLVEVL